MTRITPPADDLGRQILQIENRKPAQTRAVDETAPGKPIRDTRHNPASPSPSTVKGAPPVERRKGERRQGERRKRQQPMFLDTRSGRDRRRNPGQRRSDHPAGRRRGIDVEA